MQKSHKRLDMERTFKKNITMYIFLLLPLVYFVIFRYVPIFGNILAFRKFEMGKSYFGTEWVGFKYFKLFLTNPDFWKVFKNTIILSVSNLAFAFPLPIIFALMLNEVNSKSFKKISQSITIVPKFLSAVVVVMMMKTLLSPSNGIINRIIESFGGEAVFFMNSAEWFRPVYILSELWQFLGWNSIIYMAVLAGADQEQYEAAMVDGANKWQQAWHITIPLLIPTMSINFILSIGMILNVGFEKVLLMYTPISYKTADVIQTYVYRTAFGEFGGAGKFSYVTAIGLFHALFGLVLLAITNYIVDKKWNTGLW